MAEFQDKFKLKDKVHKKCIDSQKQKQFKIDAVKKNQDTLDKKLQDLQDQIQNVSLPEDAD